MVGFTSQDDTAVVEAGALVLREPCDANWPTLADFNGSDI